MRNSVKQLLLHKKGEVREWWESTGVTPLAVYQPKGAASQAASYVNLANPGTNDLTVGVAPGWTTETGWQFNGVDDYLIGPNFAAQAAPTGTMFIRFTDGETVGAGYAIASGGGDVILAFAGLAPLGSDADVTYAGWSNGGTLAHSPAMTEGVMGLSGVRFYRNDSVVYDTNAGSTEEEAIWIGARHDASDVLEVPWAGYIQAVFISNETLGQNEAIALARRMAVI